MDNFEEFWISLQTHLVPGTEVNNWTSLKGFYRGKMKIVQTRENFILVDSPGAKNYQRVPKQDFEKVFEVWQKYKTNQIPRRELTDLTRFSKYIISIIRWNEDNLSS